MKKCFSHKTNKTLKLWTDKSFQVNGNSPRLDKKSSMFHALTIKCIFLHKRGSPNAEAGIRFLSACTSISMK